MNKRRQAFFNQMMRSPKAKQKEILESRTSYNVPRDVGETKKPQPKKEPYKSETGAVLDTSERKPKKRQYRTTSKYGSKNAEMRRLNRKAQNILKRDDVVDFHANKFIDFQNRVEALGGFKNMDAQDNAYYTRKLNEFANDENLNVQHSRNVFKKYDEQFGGKLSDYTKEERAAVFEKTEEIANMYGYDSDVRIEMTRQAFNGTLEATFERINGKLVADIQVSGQQMSNIKKVAAKTRQKRMQKAAKEAIKPQKQIQL